jgi:uncharacterized protein (DUF2267 family)
MDYEEIIAVIQQAGGGLSRDEAERAAQATLQTLADRLSRDEVRQHLVRELPDEMEPWVFTDTQADRFGLDEFLDRVAKREDTDIETALQHARAVFFALGSALSPEALAHMASILSREYDPLLAEAERRDVDIMPAAQFWGRVAQQLEVDDAAARRITEAVLETLAERIAAGQVEDLVTRLDPLLHPPLRRGVSSSGPEARRMPMEKFLARVAAREGRDADLVDLLEEISGHARAVFTTLAEAVPAEEWYDITVELPEEYRVLLPER